MKNKIWSPRLYIEMLRQTKVVGIITAIITFIIANFAPLGNSIIYNSMPAEAKEYYPSLIVTEISFFSLSYYFLIIMTLAITGTLFSYFNKKRASDFYYAVPVSRNCYFLTALSIIFTWCIGTVVLSAVSVTIIYSTLPYAILDTSVIFNSIFSSVAIILLISGVFLVSATLSGTRLINIVLAVIILAGPRVVVTIINWLVSDITIVANQNLFPFSDNIYNIVYYMFCNNIQPAISNIPSIIYTSVLGIIYIAVAFIINKYRKAELAENAAPNKYMRHIYSAVVSFMVSIAFIYFLVRTIYHLMENVSVVFLVILFAVITVAVFFIFELISSKSLRKMLHAAPYFLVVIVLDAVVILTVSGISSSVLSTRLDMENISGIRVLYQYDEYNIPSYADIKLRNFVIKDNNLNKVYASRYNSYVDAINRRNSGEILIGQLDNFGGKQYIGMSCIIEMKDGTQIQRKFYDSKIDKARNGAILNNKEICLAASALPKDNELTDFGFFSYLSDMNVSLTTEEIKELWAIYKEEYNKFDNKKKMEISGTYYISDDSDDDFTNSALDDEIEEPDTNSKISYGILDISGIVNDKKFNSLYEITDDTPKTTKKLFEMIQKHNTTKLLDEMLNNSNGSYTVSLIEEKFLYNSESSPYVSVVYMNNNKLDTELYKLYQLEYYDVKKEVTAEDAKKAMRIIKDYVNKPIDPTKPNILIINISEYDHEGLLEEYDGNYYYGANYGTECIYDTECIMIQLSDKDFEDFKALIPLVPGII